MCVLQVIHIWMQGGAYGRDAGEVVFERESACGNGRVTVTAHAASPVMGPTKPESWGSGPGATSEQQQWRVLRFNDITRQSVARVALQRVEGGRGDALGEDWRLQAQPDCLAADYLKTVASAGVRVCGLASVLLALLAVARSISEHARHGTNGACEAWTP